MITPERPVTNSPTAIKPDLYATPAHRAVDIALVVAAALMLLLIIATSSPR